MLNEKINLNCLHKAKYIISPDLHNNLFKAKNGTSLHTHTDFSSRRDEMYSEGIFIINFKILNKSNKSLVYNYVYYRPDFCESLVLYFVIRNYYIKRARKVFFF